MLQDKLWITREIDDQDVEKLSRHAGISPLMAKILLSRGINDTEYIKKFLNPSLEDLHDPFLLEDMDKAVTRILLALGGSEKIVVYGDYDVDGITSTSVLYNFLSAHNANVEYYIPDRIDEGYGLSIGAIDKIQQMGASLVITVDCGITAIDEVRYMNINKMDVIITDHHECKENLPDAYAVVSPCRPDSKYPFKELAGIGVVFKLLTAICMRMGLGTEYLGYLDLVALGTVADVVPLVDENRSIVKYGIQKIENTLNLGLKTLIDSCALKDKAITSWTISFVMAPRVNAAGRIGDAGRAVKLFTTGDQAEALDIVRQLNEENKFRQDTEMDILQQAVRIIEEDEKYAKEKVLVVLGKEWHHGVIGIVASKITEKYYKPCILVSIEEGMGKGSGRSIEGFDIFKALSGCEELLEKYGGHELAAGLLLKVENIPAFRKKINEYADSVLNEKDLIPRIKIDAAIGRYDISVSNIKELDAMSPFGAGNPAPVFEYDGLRVEDIRTVGDNRHLKLKLGDEHLLVDAIGFNMGSMINIFNTSDSLDAACTLEINTWNSSEKVQMNLKDIRANRETAMDDQYFYSLDECLKHEYLKNCANVCRSYDDNNVNIEYIKKDEISEVFRAKGRIVVLLNSLLSMKSLERVLAEYLADIKKTYKICYTDVSAADSDVIQVVINPDPEKIAFDFVDHIVLFGDWISRIYLSKLINKISKYDKVYYYEDEMDSKFKFEEIIPDRKDLVAVYQYIKAKSAGSSLRDDPFMLARKISNSYKISMNYFKLKKCLEIFEELGLIKNKLMGPRDFEIKITDNGKQKTNLENSELFRNMQAFKIKLKEA